MTTPLMNSIIKIHIKRLGVFRVLIGAIAMYTTIPVFLLIHFVVITLISRLVIFPLLQINNINQRNFIIVDRYRVAGLGLIDTLNCLFCGWANGLCLFLNRVIDVISVYQKKTGFLAKLVLTVIAALYLLPSMVISLVMNVLNNYFIAWSQRFEKTYWLNIFKALKNDPEFAPSYDGVARLYLVYLKTTWVSLSQSLEKIESAWCPLKYLERKEGAVYPQHHKIFFEPHQVRELHEYLIEYGTVLDKREDAPS